MAAKYTHSERTRRSRLRDVDRQVDAAAATLGLDMDEALRIRAVAAVAHRAGDVVTAAAGEQPPAISRAAAAADLRRRRP